jgi:hypothetical protein
MFQGLNTEYEEDLRICRGLQSTANGIGLGLSTASGSNMFAGQGKRPGGPTTTGLRVKLKFPWLVNSQTLTPALRQDIVHAQPHVFSHLGIYLGIHPSSFSKIWEVIV